MSRREDKIASDMAGCFTDPIVCHPGGWGDTLPNWIKQAITIERLQHLKQGIETGTDAEAVAYLYTANLVAPMDSDFTDIFMYLTTKVIERWNKLPGCAGSMPADLAVRELSQYQLGELADLKHKIYNRRLKARKENVHHDEQTRKGGMGRGRNGRR